MSMSHGQKPLSLLWCPGTCREGMSKEHVGSLQGSCHQDHPRICFVVQAFWRGPKKRLSSPWDYARPEDCAELPRVETTLLGTSALSNPDSFLLSLTTDTLPNVILKSLMDSGSSDSFIDAAFVQTQHLLTYGIPPIKLRLIDGTSNTTITQALDLQLRFPTWETQHLTFFVTLLDHGCMIVLGYHWLTHFNLSIDWVLGHIIFCQTLQHESKTSPPAAVKNTLAPKFPSMPNDPRILQPIPP